MERRKTPRTSVNKLAFISFEPYNIGGVITEISRGGLRFHTVAPVQQGGMVRLSVVLDGLNRLEAVGELSWTDSTHTIGGVRFLFLSPAAADEIERWAQDQDQAQATMSVGKTEATAGNDVKATIPPAPLGQSDQASDREIAMPGGQAPDVEGLPPAQASGAEPEVRSWQVAPSTLFPVPPAPSTPRTIDAPRANAVLSQDRASQNLAVPEPPRAMPWIAHFDPDPPVHSGSPFLRGMIGGFVVCVMVAALAWFGLRGYLAQKGFIPIGSVVIPNPVQQSNTSSPAVNSPAPNAEQGDQATQATQAPPASAEPAQPSANPKGPASTEAEGASTATRAQVGDSEPAKTTNSAIPNPDGASTPQSTTAKAIPADKLPPANSALSHIATAPGPQPPAEAEDGDTQLVLARKYLDGDGRPRNPQAASQLLWSAVEKGNATAETTLADLYLRGVGVAKSCDQARVLLSAASDKGNAYAMEKLRELNQTGCR